MVILRVIVKMEIKLIEINNEKICLMIPTGANRNQEVLLWNAKVFEYFKIPVNYIQFQFPYISHGQALNAFIVSTLNVVDYYIFMEMDSIPLRKDIINIIYDKIKDKRTIFGTAQTANHKDKNHIYAAPNFLCFSKELFLSLDCPTLDDNLVHSDTAQNLTRIAEQKGYNICLIYPTKHFNTTKEEQEISGNPEYWNLGNNDKLQFGLGTTYGDLIYHSFMGSLPRSQELFIKQCELILGSFSYKDIKGWCEFEDIYSEVVSRFDNGSKFIELGTYLGKSAALMGSLIRKNNKKIEFYTVDIFENITNDKAYHEDFQINNGNIYNQFLENIKKCGVENYVKPIVSKTSEAADRFPDKYFDFIFIDAAHDYNSVNADLHKWYPKLKDNGIIAGHDYANYAPGVIKAVDEFFGNRVIKPIQGTTWRVNPQSNVKVDAIIICNGYSDYLELTLPENKKYFDHIIVVTDNNDILTQKVCMKNNIKFVFYDGWNNFDAKFNFGGARAHGFKFIEYCDYICYIDADILIKEDFRHKLIDVNKFYGSYRRFIPTYNDLQLLNKHETNQNNYEAIEGSGCGFFQIFNYYNINCQANEWKLYQDSYSAENTDIDFLKIFCPLVEHDPNLVRMNIELWHLGPHGTNNEGRSEKDLFFG